MSQTPITVPQAAPAGAVPRTGAGNFPPPNQRREDMFSYVVPTVTIAAAAAAQQQIQIQNDSYFRWDSASFYADIAAAAFTIAAIPIPNVTVQIIDGGTGRELYSLAVPIPSVFGPPNGLPRQLDQPRFFRPSSVVTFQFANFDAAVTYNIRLALHGAKIFDLGSFKDLNSFA